MNSTLSAKVDWRVKFMELAIETKKLEREITNIHEDKERCQEYSDRLFRLSTLGNYFKLMCYFRDIDMKYLNPSYKLCERIDNLIHRYRDISQIFNQQEVLA